MRQMFFCCAVLLAMVTFLCKPCLAGGNTRLEKIHHFSQRADSPYVYVAAENGNWENPDNCQNSTMIVLDDDSSFRGSYLSSIVALKASGRSAQFNLNGCVSIGSITYPKISGIYLR